MQSNIIAAIVEANRTRKEFIAEQIIKKNPRIVGIYQLTRKKDSDNFRQFSVLGVMKGLQDRRIKIVVYEPVLSGEVFQNVPVIKDLNEFK